jgi:hypothetical protein
MNNEDEESTESDSQAESLFKQSVSTAHDDDSTCAEGDGSKASIEDCADKAEGSSANAGDAESSLSAPLNEGDAMMDDEEEAVLSEGDTAAPAEYDASDFALIMYRTFPCVVS